MDTVCGKMCLKYKSNIMPRFLLLVSFCIFWSNVQAQTDDFSYEIRAGVGYTDNLTRQPANEIDDTIWLVGVDLSYVRESSGLDIAVETDIEYRDYQERFVDGETIGSANIDLNLKIVPDTFSWVFSDLYGQIQSDPFEAQTPLNREWLNTFSTGPDIQLAFGNANLVQLSGRYTGSDFEITESDSESIGGRLSFVRALSRTRQLSINVATSEIEFDNTILNDSFDRSLVYLAFNSETSRSNLELRLGHNELRFGNGSFDGSLFEISFERELSSASGFAISYEQRLTDAADRFRDLDPNAPTFNGVQNIAGIGEPFEVTNTSAAFNFGRETATLAMLIELDVNEYLLATQLDRTRLEYGLAADWQIGSRITASLGGTVARTKFDNIIREDDDFIIRGRLNMRLSRALLLSLELNWFDRESSNDLDNYTEDQAFLTLRYGP